MTKSISRSRKLLVGCAAAAGLAVAASPASADIYELQFSTSSQTGDVFFYAPAAGSLPYTVTALVANGTVIPAINGGNPIFSTETTTAGGAFVNDGNPVSLTGVVAVGAYNPIFGPGNLFSGTNDNQLLSFTNSNSSTPPSSNLDNTWFSDTRPFGSPGYNPGGIAFQAADGTQVDVFTYDDGSGPRLWVESIDTNGVQVDSTGSGLLRDLGAPAPTPATGYLGLLGLALGAAAFKLRERLAR